jgi:hypothetical protein
MGILIGPNYITEQGILLPFLYLSLVNMRINPIGNSNYQAVFIFEGYISRESKLAGSKPISLPYGHNIGELIISQERLNAATIFDLAYTSIQGKYNNYTMSNVFEAGQVDTRQYCYNADGYDINGYNVQGYNAEGYNTQGYNLDGYNAQGYNTSGYDIQGYNSSGYNSAGYNASGFNSLGYNSSGYDINGYDIYGFNGQGFSMNGGYNYSGNMPDGSLGLLPSTIIEYNKVFPENQQSFNIRIEPQNLQTYINNINEQIAAEVARLAAQPPPEPIPEETPPELTPEETPPEPTPPEPTPPEPTPEPTPEETSPSPPLDN